MGVNREKAIADVGKVIEAPQMARAWKDFGSVGAPASVRYAVDQRERVLDLEAALKAMEVSCAYWRNFPLEQWPELKQVRAILEAHND